MRADTFALLQETERDRSLVHGTPRIFVADASFASSATTIATPFLQGVSMDVGPGEC
jgi:hypothetical protein